jgi:hypothetical protein
MTQQSTDMEIRQDLLTYISEIDGTNWKICVDRAVAAAAIGVAVLDDDAFMAFMAKSREFLTLSMRWKIERMSIRHGDLVLTSEDLEI